MPEPSNPPGIAEARRLWLPLLILIGAALAVVLLVAVSYGMASRTARDDQLIPRRVVVSQGSIVDARGDVDILHTGEADDHVDVLELYGALLPAELEVRLTLAKPIPQGLSADDQSIIFMVWVAKGAVPTATAIRVENTPNGTWAAWLQGARDERDAVELALAGPAVDGATITVRVPVELLPPSKRWRLAVRSLATVPGSDEEEDWGWLDDLPAERHGPTDEWLLLHR